jgi:hypothetical protein
MHNWRRYAFYMQGDRLNNWKANGELERLKTILTPVAFKTFQFVFLPQIINQIATIPIHQDRKDRHKSKL